MKSSIIARFAMWMSGRILVTVMRVASAILPRRLVRRATAVSQTADLDRTGILVNTAKPLNIVWQDTEVIFPMYANSLAHSLWRAQEFSLFRLVQPQMKPPILDLGCGDGSFAAALFDHLDYGLDIDADALRIAQEFDIYGRLIQSTDTRIPLSDGTIACVISNSVLEHVKDLDAVVGEIARLLCTDGQLIFSVPVRQFARDLTKFFGRRESEKVNTDYYHRNLLEISEWQSLLAKHGLVVVSIRQFQPEWFTFYYWMLRFSGRNALGRLFPNIREKIWQHRGDSLVAMVKDSIGGNTARGGNIFVMAKKSG